MILIGASQLDILFCDKPTLLSKIAQLSFTVFRFKEKCFYTLERAKDIFLNFY